MQRNSYCSLKAPFVFPDSMKFHCRGFSPAARMEVGFGHKSRGTDGRPTLNSQGQ